MRCGEEDHRRKGERCRSCEKELVNVNIEYRNTYSKAKWRGSENDSLVRRRILTWSGDVGIIEGNVNYVRAVAARRENRF